MTDTNPALMQAAQGLVLQHDADHISYLVPRSLVAEFEAWLRHVEEVKEYGINGQDVPEWTGTNFSQYRFASPHPILADKLPFIHPAILEAKTTAAMKLGTITGSPIVTDGLAPSSSDKSPWVFRQDEESHWYLIPQRLAAEFETWLEHVYSDIRAAIVDVDYPEWQGTDFEPFICESPTQYVFNGQPTLIS